MGGLDGWWTGLRPGDRRLVALFLGIIILTLPFYVLALRLTVGSGTLFAAALGRGAATPTPSAPLSPGEIVTRGTASTVLVLVRDARGQLSNGTGVAVQRDRVITNAHVVEGAAEILLATGDKRVRPGEVLGLDARRDVALLQVSNGDLTPAALGDSSRLQVLDDVVALGFPALEFFQDAAPTASPGVVSKLFAQIDGLDFIQTTAQLNPGNSGGPLFNRQGEVVGLSVARIERAGDRAVAGISLAIPINEVKERLPRLASGPRPTVVATTGTPAASAPPQEVVVQYYRLVTTGDLRRAYESFTRGFQQRHPYSEFEGWFKDKEGIWLERAQAEADGANRAIVTADVLSSDRQGGQVANTRYRERWRVVQEADAWKIDDLLDTRAFPSPTPAATASPFPTPTATRLPPSPAAATATPRPEPTAPPVPPSATPAPATAPPAVATATRRPTQGPAPTAGNEPRCQSAAGVAVPQHYFDVLEVRARPNAAGELHVDGVIRNNCDRPGRALVRAAALDAAGNEIANTQAVLGPLPPEGRVPISLNLGQVRGVTNVRVTTDRE
jgi:S1-C subfamily serine protease